MDERRQQENCTQDRHRHVVPSLKLETKFPFLYVFLSFLFSQLLEYEIWAGYASVIYFWYRLGLVDAYDVVGR